MVGTNRRAVLCLPSFPPPLYRYVSLTGFSACDRGSKAIGHSPALQSYSVGSPHSKGLSDIKERQTVLTIIANNNRQYGLSQMQQIVLLCSKASAPSPLQSLAGDPVMSSSVHCVCDFMVSTEVLSPQTISQPRTSTSKLYPEV